MAKISLAPAQWTGVAVLLVVVGMGLEGLRRNAMLKLEARQAATPAASAVSTVKPFRLHQSDVLDDPKVDNPRVFCPKCDGSGKALSGAEMFPTGCTNCRSSGVVQASDVEGGIEIVADTEAVDYRFPRPAPKPLIYEPDPPALPCSHRRGATKLVRAGVTYIQCSEGHIFKVVRGGQVAQVRGGWDAVKSGLTDQPQPAVEQPDPIPPAPVLR